MRQWLAQAMTTRADPVHSWETACRHFFRHLDEPRELRRNPIAARFFSATPDSAGSSDELAVEAIRGALRAALDEDEVTGIASSSGETHRRARAIVESHVLAHGAADAVAADLHLSRSQFYRERRAICTRLARAISCEREREGAHPAVSVALEADAVAIDRARHLVEACETQRALDVLADVACGPGDAARRIEAACLRADTLTAQLHYDDARRHYGVACAVLAEAAPRLSGPVVTQCKARIDFSAALLAASAGRADEANRLTATVMHVLRRLGNEVDARALQVDVLTFAAGRATENGDFTAFRRHLADAQLLLATIPNASPRQKAALLVLSGLRCNDRGSGADFSDCIRVIAVARDMAQKCGMIVTAVNAALDESSMYAFGLGDFASAWRRARPLVDIALQSRDPVLVARVCIAVADIHIANRQFAQALDSLSIARKRGRLDSFNDVVVQCYASEAYIGLREYRRAIALASTAYQTAVSLENRRLQEGALRLGALAHFGNHEVKLARERINAALNLVGSTGARTSTALTYLASATITGKREHARIARALNPSVVPLLPFPGA